MDVLRLHPRLLDQAPKREASMWSTQTYNDQQPLTQPAGGPYGGGSPYDSRVAASLK